MTNYKELLAQRKALDKKQMEESRNAELNLAIAQVRQLIADWSMTSEDCGFKSGAASASKKANSISVAVPKFCGSNGQVLDWTRTHANMVCYT